MALEADRLSFSYGEVPVLSCASFGLPQGGFAALIGPNGAGKSTLLKLLLGELSPSSGAVRLLGQDTARFRNWRRLGYVPQDGLARHTDFPASVEEVVLANLSGEIGLLRFPRQEHRERVRQALELVGMAGYGRRLIGALSGGQRQRVLLARALISRPEVMLLDEPTSGMDLQSGENFYRLLAGLNRDHGLTILMVGHDVDRVCSYVSTLYCLEEGTLAELTPGQVRRERAGLHRHSDMTRERRGNAVSIFEYPFMQRAFLVGILLALIIPCVGIVIVLKRLSTIGDALSHTSLAGVAAGLLFNINPVLGATAACVAAAFGIEAIRKKLPRYAEMSIAIILSAGVGLAGVLSGFVRSAASFNSFLFGSIVAISDGELYTVAVVSGIIVLAFLFLYKELFYLALDERAARMSGIPVGIINSVFTVLIAVTVSIAARTVGALIVSSMMVVPVACGMQLGRSYKQTVLWSIAFAEGFTVGGLFLSYYVGLKPGGTIVLLGVACLLLLLILKPLFARLGRAGRKELKGEHDD